MLMHTHMHLNTPSINHSAGRIVCQSLLSGRSKGKKIDRKTVTERKGIVWYCIEYLGEHLWESQYGRVMMT